MTSCACGTVAYGRSHFAAFVEPLEARIAPATLVNATTVTFQDVDGDMVTLKVSRPIFTDINTANAVLNFDTGSVDGSNATAQQLRRIDLTEVANPADASGINITLTAKRSAATGGDGFVNLGDIYASNIDLGIIKIAGDLSYIRAGDANPDTMGVKQISVHSFGAFGGTTQPSPIYESTINGRLGALTVKTDVHGVWIDVFGGTNGSIGSVKIGGSLIGGADLNAGKISASGDIGSVSIGGDIRGGTAADTGRITAKTIKSIYVGGSVIGGTGTAAGSISASTSVGTVKIGRDLVGNIAAESGQVFVGKASAITIGGSVLGGGASNTGVIYSVGDVGKITIGGDLVGGDGDESGVVQGLDDTSRFKSVTIKGSILGGAGEDSGQIIAGNQIGSLVVGRDVIGGSGFGSANIGAANAGNPNIGSIRIGGSFIGYSGTEGARGPESALIYTGEIGSIKIGGNIIGGVETNSAQIYTWIDLGSVSVGGSVIGGAESYSGGIFSDGTMGPVTIRGDLRGGAGLNSGAIESADDLASVTIGGSVISGTGPLSGSIMSAENIGKVVIGGSVRGNAAMPVQISGAGYSQIGLAIASVTIKGHAEYLNLLAGYDDDSPEIGSAQIGKVSVGGNWIASNAVAGATRGGDGFFGTLDDEAIGGSSGSRIASIIIKGMALGTPGGSDAFGIVAANIGAVKIGSVKYPLTSGTDIIAAGATGDFTIREDI